MLKMRIFILLLFVLTFRIGLSQSYSFTNYSIPQGLAQTQVKAITEDKNGYLWIGTLGGLSRFNGVSFQNFSTEDGILNNRITALFSQNDKLWIGHRGGLSLYKGSKFKTWSFGEKFKNIDVSKILAFQNKIIIATNGNGLYVLEKNKLFPIPLTTDDLNRVRDLEIFNNTLYIATRAGLVKTQDLKSFIKIKNEQELNLTGISLHQSQLYLTTTEGDVIIFKPNEKKFEIENKLLSQVYLNSCLFDSKGNFWSSCADGVIFKKANGQIEIINEELGLPFNACNLVYEDKNGTIWIGSDGKGLFRFAGTQMVYFSKRNGISSDLITSTLALDKNTILFGSYDNGEIIYNGINFQDLPLKKNCIWSSTRDAQQNIWIGTANGLFKTNLTKTEEFNEAQGAPGTKVTCFYHLKNGSILVGGSSGISIIKNGQVKAFSPKFSSSSVGTIRNIVVFKSKIICATDGGLFEYKNGSFKRFLNLKLTTYSLKEDGNNALWIGTEDGLFWTDGKVIKKMFLSDLPASNFINFINFYDSKLFVGTNNGLYVLKNLHKKLNAKVYHFGIEEGVVNLETNINSSAIDKNGLLWFGTASGLVRFNTESIDKMQTVVPDLNVIGIKINFDSDNFTDYAKNLNAFGLPSNLDLPHNKNNLIIELDGVQLKNYQDLKYEYWLEGLDEKWTSTFNSSLVNLSNLPSGTYTLHIRARNGLNTFSKEYQLEIHIKPVFYLTWWFISITLLVVSGLVYAYFNFRINRERAKRYQESLEYKTKLMTLEQQSLNASMNRHFIFNSLNSIQYFINTQDKYSANKYLTNFAKLIRKNLDSSSENNNQVTLQQEIERLELYLSLESMRFKDRFDYQIETGDIDLESIEVPAMLFQPFVENSIIHGILPITERKGLIKIILKQENDKIIVSIEDNGIGIENSMAKKGLSAGDHKSQGMEITAKRINLLNKLSRQDFELDGPFQIEDENRLINGTRVLIKIPLNNLVD